MAINIGSLLKALVTNGGSDLHLASGVVPMMRIHGDIVPIQLPQVTPQDMEEVIKKITTDKQQKELHAHKSIDFAFVAAGIGTFRCNVFYQKNGLSLVTRRLPEKSPSLDDLKLPPVLKTISQYPNGLILVTGPTGSGKSTTLAAIVDDYNSHIKGHILTLEDPIEFRHEPKFCMVNQRALGEHFTDFNSALRAALREDPDVILVGELRDRDTIKLALEAAETGHLVLGTLHTNSAAKSIDRIINVFPAEEQNQIRLSLSETVKMIVAQKLVIAQDKKSRLCFLDILINNHAIANLIRENKTTQIISAMQTGKSVGMQLIDQELAQAYKNKLISLETAFDNANDKEIIKRAQGGTQSSISGSGTGTRLPESA